MMKDNVERLIDDVIKKYGFETKETINFCKICCKKNNTHTILKKYVELMDCY